MPGYRISPKKTGSRSNKPMTQWCVDRINEFFKADSEALTWYKSEGPGLVATSTVNENGTERYLSINMFETNLLRIEMLRSPSNKEVCDYIEVGICKKAWPGDSVTLPKLYKDGWPNPMIVERINGILSCLNDQGLIPRLRLRRIYDPRETYGGYFAIADTEGLTMAKMGRGGSLAIAIEPESVDSTTDSFIYSEIFPEPEDRDTFWAKCKQIASTPRTFPPVIRKKSIFHN